MSICRLGILIVVGGLAAVPAWAAGALAPTESPWMDPSLSPDQRADRLNSALTTEERLTLVHGLMPLPAFHSVPIPADAQPSAGYVPGIPRLGIPAIRETDAGLGVAYVGGLRHDGATPMPSTLALASSWDPHLAYQDGTVIGQEAWRKGFNVLLAGGVNLARDPRNGRNFEYLGEDPLLAGTLDGEVIRGVQDQHVVSTIKHYAVNDQETGRTLLNAKIGEAALRESDLLAFELAIEDGHPGAVMCSYNRVNGPYACENKHLLQDILKTDWRYPGWVMSDWGAVHSVESALAGLDQESGEQLDGQIFFGSPLKTAVASNRDYANRLKDMTRRILRSLFAVGVFDHPPVESEPDFRADGDVAETVAEHGMVLLSNPRGLLPLSKSLKRIAVIGGHSDVGVLSGGGSSQVAPVGGPALSIPIGSEYLWDLDFVRAMYHPSSPFRAIKAMVPQAEVHYEGGSYPSAAAALARRSDVALVFVTKWMGESRDTPDLTLPDGQDALVEAVAAANPNTVVILETGGPTLMPWRNKVAAVLEAWYPGGRGGPAIAKVLFGDAEPSGRLPVSFPAQATDLARPVLPGSDGQSEHPFDVEYREGADVGYRWFAANGVKPLYPFGYGLSYTAFSLHDLRAEGGKTVTLTVSVTNTGKRIGSDVVEAYVTGGPMSSKRRLIGWQRVDGLNPGDTRTVSLTADPRLLADWDDTAHAWTVRAGTFQVSVGASSEDDALSQPVTMAAATLRP